MMKNKSDLNGISVTAPIENVKAGKKTKRPSGPVWIRIAILAGIVLAVLLTLEWTGLRLSDFTHEKIKRFVLSYGAWAPFIYVATYAVRSIALVVPAGILSFVGGLVFGKGLGFVVIMIGSEAGACLAFAVCRIFGRTLLERFPWLHQGKMREFDSSTEANGFRLILFLRLVPVFPYDAINIAAGLSRVRFRDFALASFIGLIPASCVEAVLGSSFGDFRSPYFIVAAATWMLMMAFPLLKELPRRRQRGITRNSDHGRRKRRGI
jgi:uncharacterized membrane protein YdjX (TVP38/TMEM64 family)